MPSLRTKRKLPWYDVPQDFAIHIPLKFGVFERSCYWWLVVESGLDYKALDVKSMMDSTLTYQENLGLLKDYIVKLGGHVRLSQKDERQEMERARATLDEWNEEMEVNAEG